ncbi:hypothetical protein EGR_07576 [Echinococcus granulosus]|uniref:Uncharacterized protein n=1 Tax=Echinococcus granulosus TaxID=6210 RepID=W6U978_ECHGR|nr:hypothetical protein EGR_07576 [Echinococcus granulosus]EUB57565.1 hypothetical protein EGR_07576 [Echinococcus granulosus]
MNAFPWRMASSSVCRPPVSQVRHNSLIRPLFSPIKHFTFHWWEFFTCLCFIGRLIGGYLCSTYSEQLSVMPFCSQSSPTVSFLSPRGDILIGFSNFRLLKGLKKKFRVYFLKNKSLESDKFEDVLKVTVEKERISPRALHFPSYKKNMRKLQYVAYFKSERHKTVFGTFGSTW